MPLSLRTSSLVALLPLTITGVPQAIASTVTNEKVSSKEGFTNTSAIVYILTKSNILLVFFTPIILFGRFDTCLSFNPTKTIIISLDIISDNFTNICNPLLSFQTLATPNIIFLSFGILYLSYIASS